MAGRVVNPLAPRPALYFVRRLRLSHPSGRSPADHRDPTPDRGWATRRSRGWATRPQTRSWIIPRETGLRTEVVNGIAKTAVSTLSDAVKVVRHISTDNALANIGVRMLYIANNSSKRIGHIIAAMDQLPIPTV